jgi:hypothetical protein
MTGTDIKVCGVECPRGTCLPVPRGVSRRWEYDVDGQDEQPSLTAPSRDAALAGAAARHRRHAASIRLRCLVHPSECLGLSSDNVGRAD